MNEENQISYRKQARLKIALQMTAIVVVLLIVVSIASVLVVCNTLNKLKTRNTDKVVEVVGKMVSSSHRYVTGLMLDIQSRQGVPPMNSSQFYNDLSTSIREDNQTQSQELGDDLLSRMTANRMLGIEVAYFALLPTGEVNTKPTVIISSDEDYVYKAVPKELTKLVQENTDYKLFSNGIPEMGLEGAYLVTTYIIESDNPAGGLWYFDFKPMDKLLSGIDSFYAKESREVYQILGIVMGISIVGIIIASMIGLGFLLNRRITRPVEELSQAAKEIMTGDLSTRVAIRPREEFQDLKRAFNEMVGNLEKIIAKAAKVDSGDLDKAEETEERNQVKQPKYFKPRSTILFQITALYIVFFLVTGILATLFVNRSMKNLLANSKEKLIQTEAELVSSSHGFVLELILKVNPYTPEQIKSLVNSIAKREANKQYKPQGAFLIDEMINYGLAGFSLIYDVMPPTPSLSDTYLIIYATDPKFMFKEPVKEIRSMLDKGKDTWKLFKNGIPEMGLDGEYLVTTYRFSVSGGIPGAWSVDFKPMGKELKAIDSFYNKQTGEVRLSLGLTVGVSLVFIVLITFFALNYLIRKKITEPVDSLIVTVNKVMEGNLDVEVEIRPGEELEGLKRAFNEMIKSLRDLLTRSTT